MARGLLILLALVGVALLPARASALEINDQLEVNGHLQVWLTAFEQVEEANNLFQNPSRDPAATWASGFSIPRARIGARLSLVDGLFGVTAQLRLEQNPNLLDLYLTVEIAPFLTLVIGQQKIPGPRVTLCPSRDLDFIFRPQIAERIADYALSRTNFISSLFYGVHSYLRDLGVGLRGDLDLGFAELRYFALMANGLGTNLFIGNAQREFIITNPGQFYYGGRVELAEILGWLSVGAHASYNQHDNMVYNSGRVVIDLARLSYSTDARLEIPGSGVRIDALFGGGEIRDDYDDDGRVDLRYFGWAGGLTWSLSPLWAGGDWAEALTGHDLRIGGRYDFFTSEWNENASYVAEHRWAIGLSYAYERWVEIQVNYVIKQTQDPSVRDLEDDLVLVQVEAAI